MRCVLSAVVIAIGLLGFGGGTSKCVRESFYMVEVYGLSEKVIRADIGDVRINFSNNNSKLEELYKKRVSDKTKVIAFLNDNRPVAKVEHVYGYD